MVTIDDAKYIADVVAKDNLPYAILVFGSVAMEQKGNDLDLLIIANDTNKENLINSIKPFKNNYEIDYFIISLDIYKKNIREGAPFLKSIRKHGRILYMDHLETWKNLSLEDFNQAKYLRDGGYHRGACYHAQQSIEKCFKYNLLKNGWDLQKIHNIRRLNAISKNYDLDIQIKEKDLDFIDSIYIGRYPTDIGLLPDGFPDENDSQRALSIARHIFEQLGMDQ